MPALSQQESHLCQLLSASSPLFACGHCCAHQNRCGAAVTCRWVAAAHAQQHSRRRAVYGLAVDPADRASWLLTRWLAPLPPPPGYDATPAAVPFSMDAAADGDAAPGGAAAPTAVTCSQQDQLQLARLVALIPALKQRWYSTLSSLHPPYLLHMPDMKLDNCLKLHDHSRGLMVPG